jgi:hypothetical protein
MANDIEFGSGLFVLTSIPFTAGTASGIDFSSFFFDLGPTPNFISGSGQTFDFYDKLYPFEIITFYRENVIIT